MRIFGDIVNRIQAEQSSKQSSAIWMLLVVPVLSLLVNIIFSAAQDSYGTITIVVSISFLILLIAELSLISKHYLLRIARSRFTVLLEESINQEFDSSEPDDSIFDESIITDRQLSRFEESFAGEEIWVISYDLEPETDGGLYADIIPANIAKGIKYKYFVPKSDSVAIKIAQLKAKYNNSANVEFYVLSDDFFFLVPKLDIIIYNPLKKSSTGRRVYFSLDLPNTEDLYEAWLDDSFADTISSRIYEKYIPGST